MRPRIPRDWDFLDVNGLRVADSRIRLEYRRSGSEHAFLLQPLEGMVPLRVIFEPAVYASGIAGVTVDGQPAVLDVRRSADRWICPLQVVLDHERAIVIQAPAEDE